jgi:3-dehydro-4-phosphotetronate decarboxylase
MAPSDLAWLDDSGVQHSGSKASKTIVLHRTIYAADPNAHCVIHTHATHCVAATLQAPDATGDLLPPITPYFVMKVGHVPRIAYGRPGHPDVAEAGNGSPVGTHRRSSPVAQRIRHKRLT